MNRQNDNLYRQWKDKFRQKDFLYNAIQRLRFKNGWTKEELCRHLDINLPELHKLMKGEQQPPESLLLILMNELEGQGPYERRGKVRMGEVVDRLIQLEHRIGLIEKHLGHVVEMDSNGGIAEIAEEDEE